MKLSMQAIALATVLAATGAQAEQMVRVDGEDYKLSDLTANCQSITNDPAAQIACFASLSQLMAEQGNGADDSGAIAAASGTLMDAAQYQDDESGLLISAEGCELTVVYYGNYFHISRRNISSVDIFAATFDAGQLQLDQTLPVQGSQVPMLRASLTFGSTAKLRGGMAMESGPGSFHARAPGMPLADFAREAIGMLPVSESQTVDFVLVHPQRNAASAEILSAFQGYVNACQG